MVVNIEIRACFMINAAVKFKKNKKKTNMHKHESRTKMLAECHNMWLIEQPVLWYGLMSLSFLLSLLSMSTCIQTA